MMAGILREVSDMIMIGQERNTNSSMSAADSDHPEADSGEPDVAERTRGLNLLPPSTTAAKATSGRILRNH